MPPRSGAPLQVEHGACRRDQGRSRRLKLPRDQGRRRRSKLPPWTPQLDKLSQYEARIFEGGPARNRAVFINSESNHEEKEKLPNHKNAVDLAFSLHPPRDRQLRGRENTLRGTPVDENRPISGRLERFFCHATGEGGTGTGTRPTRAGQARQRQIAKPLGVAACPARSSAAQRGLFEHGVCRCDQGQPRKLKPPITRGDLAG